MTRPELILIDNAVGYQDRPSALDCIGAIVGASGNLDLAAERAFGPRDPRNPSYDPKAQLIATIADDASAFDELQKQLRVLTLLQTFERAQMIGHTVEGTLDRQELPVLAKLYTQMLAVLTELTDDHTQNINSQSTSVNFSISDQVLRGLPPDVREAIKLIQQRPAPTPPATQGDIEISHPVGWSGGDSPPNIATQGVR